MLAALIATRHDHPIPPPVPVFFYSNQMVAAVNTFACLTVNRRAAALTTSLPVRYKLSLSTPGAPATLDLLNLYYSRLISYRAGDDPNYLNQTIGQIVVVVAALLVILAGLPIANQDAVVLATLQLQLATSLANLRALGVRVS